MQVEVLLFDWGGTLADVGRQERHLRAGAMRVGQMLAGVNAVAAIGDLLERIPAADANAAADPAHREGDIVREIAAWASAYNIEAEQQQLSAAANLICQSWLGALEPLPGARDALAEMHERGYRMGLVSNCMLPEAYARQELVRMGFADYLHFAVFSSGVGYRKPSSIIYEEALAQAYSGARPADVSRVLFVGDSPAFDVMAPAKLGMKTALVATHAGVWPESDYLAARPDLRVDAVAELPDLLTRSPSGRD